MWVGCLWIALLGISPMAVRGEPSPALRITGAVPTNGTLQVRVIQTLDTPYGGPVVFETNVAAGAAAAGSIPLPPLTGGTYRVRVVADVNGDGRMNSNAFGVPTEPSGRAALENPNGETTVRIEPAPADPRAWGAGVMTLYSSNPYRGGEAVWRVLPLLTYVGENVYVVGPRAGINLIKNRWVSANLVARYLFAGEAFDDSSFLEGMKNRRDTLMAGADLNLRGIGKWRIELAATTDVLGRHDGQEVDLAIGYGFRGDRWSLNPSVGLIWRSTDFNAYYFGVRPSEATAERPAYDPGSSLDRFAGVFARYELTDRWSVLGSLRAEQLSDDIQDSPIVDAEVITSMFLGLNAAF